MSESEIATLDHASHLAASTHALADTIGSNPGNTIVPTRPPAPSPLDTLVAELQSQARRGSLTDRLEIKTRLGKGGMGEVMLAEQRSVRRGVAVKRLPAGTADDRAVATLLREGLVTGTLEHPNVTPLYDLGFDDDGRPLMVLKRIEGVVWRDLMSDGAEIERRFGMDRLQWNLQILIHLCNALGYAHTKGIIHRDVKPDNVMIGEFGEVYLLDWGIAVSMTHEGPSALPRAANVREVAGTPAYMAPEMLDPARGPLTVRTDVYLLGAVLYELLTGEPPHRHRDFESFVRSVIDSKPPLPDEVPTELAEICHRAMAPVATDRYASTDELRLAVQAYLAHRGSTELAMRADQRLRELLELLDTTQAGESPETGVDEADLRLALYERFSECRFGFRQALQTWADNALARQGIGRATRAMIEYELEVGHPRAAAGLLAELDKDDVGDLRTRVEDALTRLQEEAREVERLREFRRGHERQTGRSTRRVLLLGVGIAWTITPLAGLAFPELASNYVALTALPLAYLIGLGTLRIAAARAIRRSFISRSIFSTFLIMTAVETLLSLAGALAHIDPATLQTLHFIPWLTTALTINSRFRPDQWYVPLGYAAGMVISVLRPELRILAMVMAHGVMAAGAGIWALRTLDDRAEAPPGA